MVESSEAIPSAVGQFGRCADWSGLLTSQTANLASAYSGGYDLASLRYTVGGWFYALASSSTRMLFIQRTEGGITKLQIRNEPGLNTKITAQWGSGTLRTTNDYNLNAWNRVFVSRNGSSASIRLNGVTTTGSFGTVALGQVQSRLGAVASTFPIGMMEQWLIWDYPISDADDTYLGTLKTFPFSDAPQYTRATPDPITYPATVVRREDTALASGGGSYSSSVVGNLTATLTGTTLSWTHTKVAGQSKAYFYFHLLIDGVYIASQSFGISYVGSGSDATFYTRTLTLPTTTLRNDSQLVQVGIGDAENQTNLMFSIPFTVSGNTTRWSGSNDLFVIPTEVATIPIAAITADDVLSVGVSPSGPSTVALTDQSTPSNNSPGSTAATGQYTGVTAGDVTEWDIPTSLGKQMVVVRTSATADLPHFGLTGIRTTYSATDSIFPVVAQNGGFELYQYGAATVTALRDAGIIPEQGFFRPPDGCASAAAWFAAGATHRAILEANAAFWGTSPYWMTGDNLFSGDQAIVKAYLEAAWFADGVALWVAYYRTIAGGPIAITLRDEVEGTYGLNPANTAGSSGAAIGNTAWPAAIAAFRASIPVCFLGKGDVAHSHPRGNSLWHTATYSDAAHAVPDLSRGQLGGWSRLPSHRTLSADSEHHRWPDRPYVTLVQIGSHQDYGATLAGVPTVIKRNYGLNPRDLCAEFWERASRGSSCIRAYTAEDFIRVPFEPVSTSEASPDDPRQYGPRFDTVDPISTATGAAFLIAARTIKDYTPYLLGAERFTPALGPYLKTFKRTSTRGNLLAIINLSEGTERIPASFDASPYIAAEVFDGTGRDNLLPGAVAGLLLTAGQVLVLTGEQNFQGIVGGTIGVTARVSGTASLSARVSGTVSVGVST